jgi:hypothetical protein
LHNILKYIKEGEGEEADNALLFIAFVLAIW